MTSIHPITYLIIGVIITIYSKFVESKTGSSLDLFFWAGILMIVFGFAKFAWRKTRKATEIKIKSYENQYQSIKKNFEQEHNRFQNIYQNNYTNPQNNQGYPDYQNFR